MSTEKPVRPGVLLRRASIVLVAAWAVTVARAADVDFRPTMTFGIFHGGNLAVIGGGRGDEAASLAFDLLAERKTEKSAFAFTYRPSYVAYRQNSDLNYFGNAIVMGYARESSLVTRFKVDAYVSRSDSQGQSADTADRALTFIPRTTLTHGDVRIGGTARAGPRGLVDWQLRAGADRYKDIGAFDFNDSTAIGGRLAFRGELSVRNSLGVGLELASFDYEKTSGVLVESVGIVGACQANESWLFEYSVGGTRATFDGEAIDGASFDAKLAYAIGKASTFSAGARQVFAPGTGLAGTTQDRGVWLSYGHVPTGWGLSGSVVAGYWQRDELRFANSGANQDTAAFNVNGLIGWKFNRYITIDWAYAFVDQRARNASSPTLNTSYSNYGLFLRWAIRGR